MTFSGKGHTSLSKSCEDSSGFVRGTDYAISIVADGHGSIAQSRSSYGSKIAVEVTIDVLVSILEDKNFRDKLIANGKKVLKDIEAAIVSQWNNSVHSHCVENILNAEERSDLSGIYGSLDRRKIDRMLYGTTLLVSVIGVDYSFAFQIGDGSVYRVNSTGLVERYLELHPNCIDDRTTSLCDNNALDEFVEKYETEGINEIFFICSDGFDTAYHPDNLSSVIDGIVSLSRFKETWYGAIARQVWQCTNINRCDDVSISVIFKNTPILDDLYRIAFGEVCPYKKFSMLEPPVKIRYGGYFTVGDDGDDYTYTSFEDGCWISKYGNHYFGKIINGIPDEIFYKKGNNLIRYEGKLKNFDRNGFSKEFLEDGSLIFNGYFKQGFRNGYGVEWINNKKRYEGNFKDDLYEGKGVLYSGFKKNYIEYQGYFKEGFKFGLGESLSSTNVVINKGYNENLIYMDDQIEPFLNIISKTECVDLFNLNFLENEIFSNNLLEAYRIIVSKINYNSAAHISETVFIRIFKSCQVEIKRLVKNSRAFSYYILSRICMRCGSHLDFYKISL